MHLVTERADFAGSVSPILPLADVGLHEALLYATLGASCDVGHRIRDFVTGPVADPQRPSFEPSKHLIAAARLAGAEGPTSGQCTRTLPASAAMRGSAA